MSLRVDSSSLISGALVCGNRGLGVLGSDIPSTGDNGAGYLYNDLSLPADAGKEVRGLIVTPPSAGTFFAYEDSSFEFTAPDGVYTFTYRLFVDGADHGDATVNLSIGTSPVTITGNLGTAAASGYQATISSGAVVSCAIGTAAASGYQASILAADVIACSIGAASASGFVATIQSGGYVRAPSGSGPNIIEPNTSRISSGAGRRSSSGKTARPAQTFGKRG